MRIVSLLPSATEVVCALGLAEQVVGVSPGCDWPADLERKPALMPVVPVEAWAHDEHVHQGRSVYHVDGNELSALRPDLVLSQERCALCAPRYRDTFQAANVLEHEQHVVSLEPTTLDDVWANVELLGTLTQTRALSRQLVSTMRARVKAVEAQAARCESWPRVLCLAGLDPLVVAGRWLPELVELCGGQPYARAGEPPEEIGWDALERFNPEVILLLPDNADPERTAHALDELCSHENWDEMSAVKRDRVTLFHDAGCLNRPGPRLALGLALLAKAVQPALFRGVPVPQGAMYKVGR